MRSRSNGRPSASPGAPSTGSATSAPPPCSTCSPIPSPTTRPSPVRGASSWPWDRASASSSSCSAPRTDRLTHRLTTDRPTDPPTDRLTRSGVVTSPWLFTGLVVLVGLERLAELVVSKRHAAWAFSRGGVERGQSHYPIMVALHTGLLVGAVAEVWLADRPFVPALGWVMLALVVASQALRWWCIATLGN